MLLAGLFAGCLFVALVAGDWWQFWRLHPEAVGYGCPVARAADSLTATPTPELSACFDADGLLRLDHGIALIVPGERRILLRPRSGRLSAPRFRTAWPLKGSIDLRLDGERANLHVVKRMPWSSALLTMLWFGIVGVGTLAFVVRFLAEGDAFGLGSLLLVLGVSGVGLLVLAFGIVTVSLAYRLEDQRLMDAFRELRSVLEHPTGERR